MKASELIGSSVLVLAGAEICGTVSNLIFADKLKKVSHIEVFIDDDDDCEVKYIAVRDVYSCEKDMVTVKYPAALVPSKPIGNRCPVNLPAYDESGASLGVITDVELDDWTATALIANEKPYPPADILSRSDALIVMKKEGSTTRLTRKKKKVPALKISKMEERKVTITALEFPRSLPNNYSFLYGRVAMQNISTFDGRLIIPSGTLVTPELVKIAKSSGVIAQLALYAAAI